MKDTINYYYNLNPDKINQIFQYYYFFIHGDLYFLKIYDKDIHCINDIYHFNNELLQKNVLVHEIINNKDQTILTYINYVPYILMKVNVNINKPICLEEISYLSNLHISYPKKLMRSNWSMLWAEKIDYLEYYHEQNYQKYPLLSESFDYFVGLSENAISYLNYTINTFSSESIDIGVISHDRLALDDTTYALYDPLNIIIDHKSRDISEYIKRSFFIDNYSIFDELDQYFKHQYFSIYGIHLLLARVLFPSFYFEICDDILNQRLDESAILNITSRIKDYENYLKDIWNYFHKYYNIKDISWLSSKGEKFLS